MIQNPNIRAYDLADMDRVTRIERVNQLIQESRNKPLLNSYDQLALKKALSTVQGEHAIISGFIHAQDEREEIMPFVVHRLSGLVLDSVYSPESYFNEAGYPFESLRATFIDPQQPKEESAWAEVPIVPPVLGVEVEFVLAR